METSARRVVPDSTLRDANSLPRGYYERRRTTADVLDAGSEKFAHGATHAAHHFEDTRHHPLPGAGRTPATTT
ncbi:MAG: hypothetical protein IPK19_21490 [Chloroflexi bacterium]|nr:hypothetical protein [Chloroflexota bacterium]